MEEFPHAYIKSTTNQLIENTNKLLMDSLTYEKIEVKSTPRRFALFIWGIEEKELDNKELVRGPAKKIAFSEDNEPSKALLGFLKSQNKNLEDVIIKDLKGTEYVYIEKIPKAKPVKEILKEAMPELIKSLNFPRNMKWDESEFKFARPIRWLVSIYDNEPLEFEFIGLKASNITRGHRTLGKSEVLVEDVESYEKVLKENGVIVDREKRRNIIVQKANRLAKEKGGSLLYDEDLIEEVIDINEYPTPLIGNINPKYLSLPKEVVITPMKDHQRFFPVLSEENELLPYFITVRNGDEKGLDIVKAGNEKVLEPRLEDAKFFYDEDLKKPLDYYNEILKTATFHEKLGSIYDKAQREVVLSSNIARLLEVGDETEKTVKRAAEISKADLVTKLVVEFTELEGIMGMIYAKASGENDRVSTAIMESYMPRSSGKDLPETTAGKILAIATKLDSIVGMYSVGLKVTGSKDQFGLRRKALGIIRIILENGLDLDLEKIVSDSLYIYLEKNELVFDYDETKKEVLEFFKQRLEVLLKEKFRYDVVDSALQTSDYKISTIYEKTKALNKFLEDGGSIEAGERLENIVKDNEDTDIYKDLLSDTYEKNLFNSIPRIEEIDDLILAQDFEKAFEIYSEISSIINSFLDNVIVNADDENIRRNRLNLVTKFSQTIGKLFSAKAIIK